MEKLAKNTYLFQIKCSSGTYIRSLCRDIAKELNTFAYMGAIIRTKSGNFSIEDAKQLDLISEDDIIPLKKILEDRENAFVNGEFYDRIVNGCEVEISAKDMDICVIYCKDELLGIGHIKNGKCKIDTNLRENYD